jgi:hypothetical protein
MSQDDKRQLREEKRTIKRAGNKRARRVAKRELVESPEEAHARTDARYGRYRSAPLNGIDRDSTRRPPTEDPPDPSSVP